MRPWPRPWLATAVLLAALGGGALPAAGSMAPPAGGPDTGAGQDAALAPVAETRRASGAGPLAMARRVDGLFSDPQRDGAAEPLALSFGRRGARAPRAPREERPPGMVGGERARVLLRSLTLPGWGQATLGRRTSAVFFGLTETAIWGTFTAFRIQVAMREDAFLRTAALQAGIDLRGRDEEWRRIVGGFSSSDEYNRLVVARDAANLFLSDTVVYNRPPEETVPYFDYIEQHKLKGADTWSWTSPEAQRSYRDLRKTAQRAAQRANTMLAVAVVNRIASALHAARAAGHTAPSAHAWRFEVVPVASPDPTAFQVRVRTRF